MSAPSVVVLPSWYATDELPLSGIFFREQALAVAPLCKKVGIIYPEHRSLKTWTPHRFAKHHFQISFEEDDGVSVARAHTWNLYPGMDAGYGYWVRTAARLFQAYSARFVKPDVLHAQCALIGGFAANSIRERFGVPYVLTEHNSKLAGELDPASLKMASKAYGGAASVLCVSSTIRDHILAKSLCDPAKLHIVPNLVDVEFFTLPPKQRTAKPFTFIGVGNLLPAKGYDYLLRAFHAAFAKQENVRLRLAGGGSELGALRNLAEQLGIASKVEFLGVLDRTRLRQHFWSANAFVHPSHFESFGLAVAEAMATGLPVVSTACGGPNDTVVEGTGYLVPVKDEVALADKMKLLKDGVESFDPSFIRRSVESRFSKEIVAKQIVGFYEQCAGL